MSDRPAKEDDVPTSGEGIGLLGAPPELDEPDLRRGASRSIRRNAFETVVFRGFGLPLSFAISIVTSRYLLPAGRGAFVLALLSVTITAAVFGSIGTALSHELGRRDARTRAVVTQALLLTTALSVPCAVGLALVDLHFAKQGFRPIAWSALAIVPVLISQTLSNALLVFNRLRFWNVLQLLGPAVTLTAMLVFVVVLSKGVTGALFAWGLAQAAIAAVALYGTRDVWWPIPPRLWEENRIAPLLAYGVRLGAVNVLSLVNYRVELIILEVYAGGLNSVGIYSLAVSIGELLWVASSSVSAALIAPMLKQDDQPAFELVQRTARSVTILAAALGAMLAIVSPFLIPRLFGSAFQGSVTPLLILIPGIVLFSPASTVATFFSIKLGKARYTFWMTALSAATTASVALLAAPRYGATGAAIASTTAYTVSVVTAYWWCARITSSPVTQFIPRPSDLRVYGVALAAAVRR
jgi:O-antigen/teichoic acid export membrane protein